MALATEELHEIVYEGIAEMIRNGDVSYGDKLPPERELVDRYNVSRPTVNKAVTRLITEGVLCKKPGRKGAFFASLNIDRSANNPIEPATSAKVIKYVVPHNWGRFPIKHGVMEGIYSVATELGCQTVLEFISEEAEWRQKALNCSGMECAGLVIWGHSFGITENIYDLLNNSGIPYVVVDCMVEGFDVDFVGTDNIDGANMMVDYLASLGHTNICYITEPAAKGSIKDRLAGFLRGMISNGLDVNSGTVKQITEETDETIFEAVREILARDNKPTALFASHDRFLIKISEALNKLGVRYPEDISLAGYDDIDVSSYMPVPLTTVHQDFYEMGRIAAEIIMSKEGGNNLIPQKIYLKPELIKRKSIGKVR
jgi:GntR family transcriptional regulator, arabinose operon transcriptional repressor